MYIITTCLRVGYSPGLTHFKKCNSELCCSYNSASKVHCSWLQYVTPSFYMECLLFSLWFHEQDLNHLIPLAGSSFMPAYIHYNTQWRIVTGGLGDTTPRNGSALPHSRTNPQFLCSQSVTKSSDCNKTHLRQNKEIPKPNHPIRTAPKQVGQGGVTPSHHKTTGS